ncbi:hypothetical protein JS44_03510 [Anoxybacillus flavithermus]|uniref:Uncharacterized protein n=1 Tax=Anoxybacillus flavithermus TaxID=33934 RepID=A0A094IXV4_9BACL|nr:hypothetical protein JS44_03510 [Anoxybacillus flavithermus]
MIETLDYMVSSGRINVEYPRKALEKVMEDIKISNIVLWTDVYQTHTVTEGEKNMVLSKFPMKFSTRLKQFFCKHETMGKMAFSKGINKKKGTILFCINVESVDFVLRSGRKKKSGK